MVALFLSSSQKPNDGWRRFRPQRRANYRERAREDQGHSDRQRRSHHQNNKTRLWRNIREERWAKLQNYYDPLEFDYNYQQEQIYNDIYFSSYFPDSGYSYYPTPFYCKYCQMTYCDEEHDTVRCQQIYNDDEEANQQHNNRKSPLCFFNSEEQCF